MAPSTFRIAAALSAVYVIWGSTYLAIRFAVESFPPFTMAAARWIPAGLSLYVFCRARGDAKPTLVQWRSAVVIGALLIVGGNGLVTWTEQFLPSGLTALIIAIVPVWIALFEAFRPGGERPTWLLGSGIALGLVGVGVLVAPAILGDGSDFGGRTLLGMGLILLASLSWASGSLYSRAAPLPTSALLGAAMQMIAGGAILAAVGVALGEPARLDLAGVTSRAWASLAFLLVAGSIVAYTAYVWLLQVIRPEIVATYAFVNPVVAVVLGALLADETFSGTIVLAAALIVVAVMIVILGRPRIPPDSPASKSGPPRLG